ncbi:MAG: hypothetical protein J6M42_04930, partial [Clostridia bacterium]|nr:hypothetical protein [Clostridia bacterium]
FQFSLKWTKPKVLHLNMPKGIFHLRVAQISHRRYFTRRKAYFTQIWGYRRPITPNLTVFRADILRNGLPLLPNGLFCGILLSKGSGYEGWQKIFQTFFEKAVIFRLFWCLIE